MKRQTVTLMFVFTMASGSLPAAAQNAAAQAVPTKGPSAADELARKAIAAAEKDNLEEAVELFREAYRVDHNPRWLYNLGVLHDKLAECDDAAFFYRASLWGKGVLPQDADKVDNRLGVLEDECHFKKRHATPADRHARAARYMGVRMCHLAESILTGIITPQEKKALEDCRAQEKAKPAK